MRYCNRPERLRGLKKKQQKPKTSEDLVAHFQKRCLERIGIILSQRELKQLREENRLVIIERQSSNRTKYKLLKERYNGKQLLQFDVVVVFDRSKNTFVTTWKYSNRDEKDVSSF